MLPTFPISWLKKSEKLHPDKETVKINRIIIINLFININYIIVFGICQVVFIVI
ncbi:hypothetical protein ES702_05987 [subsurface metagenome]